MAEQLSRSQYLQNLLNQRKTTEQNGSPLLDTTNNDQDSNAVVQSQETIGESVNKKTSVAQGIYDIYSKTKNTIDSFVYNIVSGFNKYFVDPIYDAGVSLFVQDENKAKELINNNRYQNIINQSAVELLPINFLENAVKGNWGAYTNIKQNYQKDLMDNSFMGNAPTDVKNFVTGAEELVGGILPSVGLAVATSGLGSSGLAKAVGTGTLALQGGIQGYGLGVGEAVGQGAELDDAKKYGAIRGGISALLTIGGGTVASQVQGNGIGTVVGNAIYGKTGNALARSVVTILTNAGISGAVSYIDTALVKPLTQLTYDEEAWSKRYGTKSDTFNTFREAGQAFLTSAVISAGTQAIFEGIKYNKLGKEGYEQQVMNEYFNSKTGYSKLQENVNKLNKLSDEMGTYAQQLNNGQINEQQYINATKNLLAQYQKLATSTQKQLNYFTNSYLGGGKNASTLGAMKVNASNYILNKLSGSYTTATLNDFVSSAIKNGYTFNEIKENIYNLNKGNTTINFDSGKTPTISYNGKGNVPITFNEQGQAFLTPTTSSQLSNALMISAKGNNSLVSTIKIDVNQFVNDTSVLPKTEPLTITKSVSKSIVEDNTVDKLKEYWSIVKENKGKQVIIDKDNNKYYIVNKGEDKTSITTVNSAFTTIQNVKVQSTVAYEKDSKSDLTLEYYNNEPKMVKAYGELNHEKVLSYNKAEDIVDIAKKQILDKISTDDGYSYEAKVIKGSNAKRIFEAYNAMTPTERAKEIEAVADDISNSVIKITSPNGVVIETTAGYKEDLVKAITGLVEAKSELSKIKKLENRIELTKFEKETQINKIKEKANELIKGANEKIKAVKENATKRLAETVRVNSALANLDITLKQYKVDKRLYKSEIENNGTIKQILSLLPRYNMVVESKGVRYSDTNGLYLSGKYAQWARDNIGKIDDLISKGAFINIDPADLLEQFSVLAYSNGDNKRLNPIQVEALTNIMKALRYQISDNANNTRVERRERAATLFKEQSSVNSFIGGLSSSFISRAGYDNVKLMDIGDLISGFDGSNLQKEIDKMTVTNYENYCSQVKDFDNKYLTTPEYVKLSKLIKGKSKFNGNKVYNYELLSIYEQLSDSETLELFANEGNYFITKNGNKIYWNENLKNDIENVLGKEIIDLDKKAIIEGIYNDKSEGSYIPKVKKWQEEHQGYTNIPDRDDYVPRSQSDYLKKNDNLTSMDMNEAKAQARGNNSLKERTQKGGKLVLKTYNPIGSSEKYLNSMAKTLTTTQGINDFLSLFELNVEVDGQVYKAKEVYGEKAMGYLTDLARTLDNQSLVKEGIFTYLQGLSASGTLGAKIFFGPIKNFLSSLKEGAVRGYKNLLKSLAPTKDKKDYHDYIKNTGTWYIRYKDGVASAMANTDIKGIVGKVSAKLSIMYEVFDKATSLWVADTCLEYVKDCYPNLNKEKQWEKAAEIWIKDINSTQSTKEKFAKSTASLGKVQGKVKSEIIKSTFAFQSDTIAGGSMVIKDLTMLSKSDKIIKNAKKIMDDPNASKEQKEQAQDFYNKARRTKARLKRGIPATMAALVGSALLKYFVDDLEQRFKGNKELTEKVFDDGSVGEIVGNTLESFMPFYSTIYSAVKYNEGATEVFALSTVNDILGGVSKVANGQTKNGLTEIGFGITKFLGLPTKTLYNDILGIINIFSPDDALNFKNIFYTSSVNTITKKYNAYASEGDSKNAVAYLSYLNSAFKGSVMSDSAVEEVTRLTISGYDVMPQSIPTAFENDNGETVKLTQNEIEQFASYYSKAKQDIDKIMSLTEYRSATSSEQAKILKKIYQNYYSFAKSKVMKKAPTSNITKLLVYTNGSLDTARYMVYLQKISAITETKNKTKKELVTEYVNKIKGISKQEKILIMYLAGYSVSGDSQKMLKKYLISKGASAKDISNMF